MFRTVLPSPDDPVYLLSQRVRADASKEKIDLGVGVYRNEQSQYHELHALKAVRIRSGISSVNVYSINLMKGKEDSGTARCESRLRSDNGKCTVFEACPGSYLWSNKPKA